MLKQNLPFLNALMRDVIDLNGWMSSNNVSRNISFGYRTVRFLDESLKHGSKVMI